MELFYTSILFLIAYTVLKVFIWKQLLTDVKSFYWTRDLISITPSYWAETDLLTRKITVYSIVKSML